MGWKDKIRNPDCELCPLHANAEFVCLLGSGKRSAQLMIVGEAPGAREDDEHAAFVGPAGQLLTSLLEEVGISREECYITNVCKCRPPGNRTPTRSEAKVCSNTYLAKEIQRVRPKVILALGNTALQGVLGRSGITKYRGKVVEANGTMLTATFHPAAALRSPKYLPGLRADFRAVARLLRGDSNDGENSVPTRVRIVNSAQDLRWLYERISDSTECAFDLETTGLEEYTDGAEIVTAGFSWAEGEAAVLAVHHPESRFRDPNKALLSLKGPLERHAGLIGHNAKFDARWLAAAGIHVHVKHDTMIQAHILDENQPKSLKALGQIHLAASDWDIGDDVKKAQMVPLNRLATYNGADCDYTLRLSHMFVPQLKELPRSLRLYWKLMMPASNVLTQVEMGGMWVDPDKLVANTAKAEEIIAGLIRMMNKTLPKHKESINYNSPQQVADWLFNDLKLPIILKTGTGNPSTKEAVLLQLAGRNKAVRALLKYRKWHKFFTTYLRPYAERQDRRGRIHTSYRITGTETGRLSSAGPNLQQVPRDPYIRAILGAPPGWTFMESDFSQVELRIVAMLARETTMLRVLAMGQDLHTNTAASILRVLPGDITKDLRVIWGKHPNFGLCYGMGSGVDDFGEPMHDENGDLQGYYGYCINNGTEITTDDAVRAYEGYHRTYPKIKLWHDREKRLAHRYGQVTSLVGRTRHLPDINSSSKKVIAAAERAAINSPAQGLASDLMLTAFVRLHSLYNPREARLVGTIHDAILSEIRNDCVDKYARLVKATMEDMSYVKRLYGATIDVPILADVSVGQHWGETHEYDFG